MFEEARNKENKRFWVTRSSASIANYFCHLIDAVLTISIFVSISSISAHIYFQYYY